MEHGSATQLSLSPSQVAPSQAVARQCRLLLAPSAGGGEWQVLGLQSLAPLRAMAWPERTRPGVGWLEPEQAASRPPGPPFQGSVCLFTSTLPSQSWPKLFPLGMTDWGQGAGGQGAAGSRTWDPGQDQVKLLTELSILDTQQPPPPRPQSSSGVLLAQSVSLVNYHGFTH